MNKSEMIKWLQNLKKDIGQPQHQDLWHYAEILDEVIGTTEVSEDSIDRYAALAELDPQSVEYKIIKDLPNCNAYSHGITLTPSQIIEEILKSGYVEEIFLELSRYLISDRKDMQKELAEKDATLRLIKKLSKDKTVLDILSD